MDLTALKTGLEDARSHEQWVDQLARFFSVHELAFGHGTETAEDEAYWLVRHVQGWRDDAWAARPDKSHVDQILDLARRRVMERRPLAYLLGSTWFAGLEFRIDERALVPRSPLAEVIERGFAPWATLTGGARVLDLGTGSGCLAVAVAHYCPGVQVVGTDVSADALALAAENVTRHGLARRVSLVQSDLFQALRGTYQVIISNPPYVPRSRLATLPAEYRQEPVTALDGGADGLAPVERILGSAVAYLARKGLLVVEVGEAAEALAQAHPRLPLTWLALEHGGQGVFVLTREQLTGYLEG